MVQNSLTESTVIFSCCKQFCCGGKSLQVQISEYSYKPVQFLASRLNLAIHKTQPGLELEQTQKTIKNQ